MSDDDSENGELAAADGAARRPHSNVRDIPMEGLNMIALHVKSPVILTLMASTCTDMSTFITNHESLWDRLFKQRWTLTENAHETYSHVHYKARHEQDSQTLQGLLSVCETLHKETDYGLGQWFDSKEWVKLRSSVKSMDLLRFLVHKKKAFKLYYPSVNVTPLIQCMATQLLDRIHFLFVLIQWNNRGAGSSVEGRALLIAESMWTVQDVVSDTNPPNHRMRTLQGRLDELAMDLKRRMDEQGGRTNMTDFEIATLVRKMLFHDYAFTAQANDVDDVRHASIEYALETGKGLPMTLAIICRSVLLRVGIRVDIVDCPGPRYHGHILIEFQDFDVFLDISDGGKVLDLKECQMIALSYGGPWWLPSEDLEDDHQAWQAGEGHLDSDEIIHDFLLSFVCFCRRKRSAELETTESLNNMRSNGNEAIARWCMWKHFLDPKLFRDFGLIDDDTMNKYVDAPYKLYR